MTTQHYDAIVIGSGQGGNPLAMALANAGMRTALIERKHVGGTCINEGCTPTKTMVASGRVAYLARRAADYGVRTGPISIDLEKVRQRKRDIVDKFRNGNQSGLEKTSNLDLIFGEASFSGTNSVNVKLKDGETRTLSAYALFHQRWNTRRRVRSWQVSIAYRLSTTSPSWNWTRFRITSWSWAVGILALSLVNFSAVSAAG